MSDYGFVHDGRTFTPNATPDIDPAANNDRNAAIERAELAHWATCPDHMLAYYTFPNDVDARQPYGHAYHPTLTGAHVTTWPGTRIGSIVSARVSTNNFGARVVALRVRGTNGAEYYGRASWDNGSCIRLRKAKAK
jgi:hypothetical protein